MVGEEGDSDHHRSWGRMSTSGEFTDGLLSGLGGPVTSFLVLEMGIPED